MRAALYHRVSTVDQRPGLARRELAAAAKRLGARVTLNIEETGSGASNNRPGLLQVLEAARRGKVDVVLVWKLDRFGRSALDLLANLRAIEAGGVRFIAVTQGLDLKPGGDAISRLLLTLLGAIAEFERDLIRERTRLGLAKAKRDGTRLGRPRVKLPLRGVVEGLRGEGWSWRRIAKECKCSEYAARQALGSNARRNRRSSKR